MLVFYRNLWVFALFGLAACSPGGEEVSVPSSALNAEQREVQPTWREDRVSLGKETYLSACASCHESGDHGAPLTGNRDQWEERSDMWQAVLSKHAKSGYLEMPGKGGQSDLSDEAVEAATEYMLGLAFPDRPMD
jgi:cytochrome c5